MQTTLSMLSRYRPISPTVPVSRTQNHADTNIMDAPVSHIPYFNVLFFSISIPVPGCTPSKSLYSQSEKNHFFSQTNCDRNFILW